MSYRNDIVQEDGQVFIRKAHDVSADMRRIEDLRSLGQSAQDTKRGRHVGAIPYGVLDMWMQEEGVLYSEPDKVKEVIKKKLLSGDFAKLRLHEGTF